MGSKSSKVSFSSGGHSIAADLFVPDKPGKHPAVIALHGSGGLKDGFYPFATKLADQNYVVAVVHYFDRTGTGWASPKEIDQNFVTWLDTIGDAISFVAEHPAADPNRIGMIGFSLGAYLTLSLATRETRIKTIIDFFGGLPKELHVGAKDLPPVLILHGSADTVVPVSEAHTLKQLMDDADRTCDMKIYDGEGHTFSMFSFLDAGLRTYRFLETHLRGK